VAATVVAGTAGCGNDEPGPAPLTGFTADLREHIEPAHGGLVQWKSTWWLRWTPAEGAREYLVYTGSSEGDSTTARVRREPRYGIEVANGVSRRSQIERLRSQQVAFTAAQLTISVAARYDDGEIGPRSGPYAVGEPVPAR
jgi:hypothetical protein